MTDPYWFEDEPPEGTDEIYDSYDEMMNISDSAGENADILDLGPDKMGIALALAEEIAEERASRYWETEDQYDLDENTDKENWERAMKFTSLNNRHKKIKLRPFEQYIDDICKGRRPLFEDDSEDDFGDDFF